MFRPAALARLVLGLVLVACSGGETLPEAADLLARASRAMSDVRSVRFAVEVEGPVVGIPVTRADGVTNREGESDGTVAIKQGSSLIEYDVIVADGTYYLKGPTGGFQAVPSFIADQLYDPSSLLDPDQGVATALSDVREARTEAAESVEGVPAYRVSGMMPSALLRGLLPLEEGQDEVPALFWIGSETPHLIRAQATVTVAEQTESTTLTLTLSDFDLPTDIRPPET